MMNGFGMGFGWIFGLLFLIVLVWLVIRLVSPGQTTNPPSQKEDALDILKKRYARGEISKEEYEQMKKDLL